MMEANIDTLTIQSHLTCLTVEDHLKFELFKRFIRESYHFSIAVSKSEMNDIHSGLKKLNIIEPYGLTAEKITTAFRKTCEIFEIEWHDVDIKDSDEKNEPAPLKELWNVFQYIDIFHIIGQVQTEIQNRSLVITLLYSPKAFPDKKMTFEISLPLPD